MNFRRDNRQDNRQQQSNRSQLMSWDVSTVREVPATDRHEARTFWTRIGKAFENAPNEKNPQGTITLKLDALPLSNQDGQAILVLTVPREDDGGRHG